jgi:hypothetical protein
MALRRSNLAPDVAALEAWLQVGRRFTEPLAERG